MVAEAPRQPAAHGIWYPGALDFEEAAADTLDALLEQLGRGLEQPHYVCLGRGARRAVGVDCGRAPLLRRAPETGQKHIPGVAVPNHPLVADLVLEHREVRARRVQHGRTVLFGRNQVCKLMKRRHLVGRHLGQHLSYGMHRVICCAVPRRYARLQARQHRRRRRKPFSCCARGEKQILHGAVEVQLKWHCQLGDGRQPGVRHCLWGIINVGWRVVDADC